MDVDDNWCCMKYSKLPVPGLQPVLLTLVCS